MFERSERMRNNKIIEKQNKQNENELIDYLLLLLFDWPNEDKRL